MSFEHREYGYFSKDIGNLIFGADGYESPPPVLETQYAVILPSTMDHFDEWILSPARTEPVKMREKTVSACKHQKIFSSHTR